MARFRALCAAVNSPCTEREERPLTFVRAERADDARRGAGLRIPAGHSSTGPGSSPPSPVSSPFPGLEDGEPYEPEPEGEPE